MTTTRTTDTTTGTTTGAGRDGTVLPLLHPRLAALDPVALGEHGRPRTGRVRLALGVLGTCLGLTLGVHTAGAAAPAPGVPEAVEATRQTQSSPSGSRITT